MARCAEQYEAMSLRRGTHRRMARRTEQYEALRCAEGIAGASDALGTALAVSEALNTLLARVRKAKCSA